MQQVSHVSREHRLFQLPGYAHHTHIACGFVPSKRHIIGGERMTSPLPYGMSGGLVFANRPDRMAAGEIVFQGVVGVAIEYRKELGLLIGVHIGVVFDVIRSLWPELRAAVPNLRPDGTYSFD